MSRPFKSSALPHHLGFNVSDSAYKFLVSKLDKRNKFDMQKLLRRIVNVWIEAEKDMELDGMLDKQVKWLENNEGKVV
jgi:hypothetical protein